MISLIHESKMVITSNQAQRSDMDEKLQWCEQKGSARGLTKKTPALDCEATHTVCGTL